MVYTGKVDVGNSHYGVVFVLLCRGRYFGELPNTPVVFVLIKGFNV